MQNNILAEKRGVSFTLFPKMHENSIFSLIRGGGRTPATPDAGSAIDLCNNSKQYHYIIDYSFPASSNLYTSTYRVFILVR